MKLALTTTQTDDGADPARLAELVESLDGHGLYFTEHTHRTGVADPSIDYLFTAWDPFVAAHAAAAVTTRLRVGSGVALLAQHEPITLAHRLASLDRATGGRLDVGAGGGWNAQEMRNHGVDPAHRVRALRENVGLLKALWSGRPQTHDGERHRFRDATVLPRPVQPGGPPILLGGSGPGVIGRIERWGDGWMPIYDPRVFDSILERMGEVRRISALRGRDVPVVLVGAPADADVLRACARAGIVVAPTVPPSSLTTVEATLQRFRELGAPARS